MSKTKSPGKADDRIFVSYRRDDAAGWTTKLTEELTERFSSDAALMQFEVSFKCATEWAFR